MKTVKLADLLQSIAHAVADTQRATQQFHQANLHSHFEGADDGPMRPKTMNVLLPRDHVTDAGETRGVAAVPEFSLANHDQIHLGELELSLDCVVDVGFDEAGDPALSLLIGAGLPKPGPSGRLVLRYRVVDTPEGVSQMNDSALKSF